ncbi:hypothetical protein EMGBS4_17870, partial [Acidimicrobiaceae bacterium]
MSDVTLMAETDGLRDINLVALQKRTLRGVGYGAGSCGSFAVGSGNRRSICDSRYFGATNTMGWVVECDIHDGFGIYVAGSRARD